MDFAACVGLVAVLMLVTVGLQVSAQTGIDVRIEAPWSSLYPGQSMDLTVIATVEGAPLSGADVRITSSSVNCSFSPAMLGPTGADGKFTVTITCSTIETVLVTATVSKAPYSDGTASYVIDIGGQRSMIMTASSKTKEMMSYETATINVRLVDSSDGAGVPGALVATSSRLGGTFSVVTDYRDGNYSFRWEAPKVSVQTVATIAIAAKVGGYADARSALSILVDPNATYILPHLYLFAVPAADTVRPGETLKVTVYVYTIEGYAVTGATVRVTLRYEVQGTVVQPTDELNGVYIFYFTPSPSVSNAFVTMRIDAAKYGYGAGTTRLSVFVTS